VVLLGVGVKAISKVCISLASSKSLNYLSLNVMKEVHSLLAIQRDMKMHFPIQVKRDYNELGGTIITGNICFHFTNVPPPSKFICVNLIFLTFLFIHSEKP